MCILKTIKKKDKEVDDWNETKTRITWLLKQFILLRQASTKTTSTTVDNNEEGQKKK